MKGRPTVCRACHAGLCHGDCVSLGFVYCMACNHCGEFYIGETDRERFNKHYRDANKLMVRTPWGSRYYHEHRESVDTKHFSTFSQGPYSRQEVLTPIAQTTGSD